MRIEQTPTLCILKRREGTNWTGTTGMLLLPDLGVNAKRPGIGLSREFSSGVPVNGDRQLTATTVPEHDHATKVSFRLTFISLVLSASPDGDAQTRSDNLANAVKR